MKNILLLLYVLGLSWILVGCEAPTTAPTPSSSNPMIEAGQTTQPVGSFVVAGGGDNNTSVGCIDCEPETSLACPLLSGADSVALIWVPAQEPTRHLLPEDECSGPYSNSAVTLSAEVLGVIWGEPLPQHLQVTKISDLGSVSFGIHGTTHFVSIRFSENEAIATYNLPVVFDEGQVQALGTKRYFPDSFEGAVDFLNETWSHWEESCPHHSNFYTDEEFDARVRDARTMGYDCIPDGPPPAEQPPSEECTDLYPCDP